jgi:hypothetical protein
MAGIPYRYGHNELAARLSKAIKPIYILFPGQRRSQRISQSGYDLSIHLLSDGAAAQEARRSGGEQSSIRAYDEHLIGGVERER